MATLEVTAPKNSQNIEGIARVAAPLERVFAAYIDADLFSQWWGRGHPMKIHRFDCRDGGAWRVTEITPDGAEHEFFGVFHEVALNQRIVQTFEYLGMAASGAEAGWRQSVETLGKLLEH